MKLSAPCSLWKNLLKNKTFKPKQIELNPGKHGFWSHYSPTKKYIFQWLKGKRSAAAGFLLKDDLKPTANPDECLALLKDAWDPICFAYRNKPKPQLSPFLEKYKESINKLFTPCELPNLTGTDLFKAATRRNPKAASGLDGWATCELQRLPEALWIPGAYIFNQIEDQGIWPDALLHIPIAWIPKA